ncbi:HAD-IA family hydrolase [Streptomyces sp. NPDC020898]|uniref:HAD-IA family hydrolase n=1 Tax=Streptomyces sp. NPDC020898 TaxID=3365101 RepID=UPI0037A2E4F5
MVTSWVTVLARARLTAAGLPAPPVLITVGDVSHGKPAPDGYRSAAEKLGFAAARTVVFEDSTAGGESRSRGGRDRHRSRAARPGHRRHHRRPRPARPDMARRRPQPRRRGPAAVLTLPYASAVGRRTDYPVRRRTARRRPHRRRTGLGDVVLVVRCSAGTT